MSCHKPIVMLALLLGLSSAPAVAQDIPVMIEIRGLGSHPVGDWADDDDVEFGWGYGAALHLRTARVGGIYAGWDRIRFDVEPDGEDDDDGPDSQVGDEGIRVGLELGTSSRREVAPYLFAGLYYAQTTSSAEGGIGMLTFTSDYGLGYEAGVGAALELGSMLVRPSVAYRSHESEFDVFGELVNYDLTVSYVVLGLGITSR
jgi:hypothetical protein